MRIFKKTVSILFLLTIFISFSQSKEQLIDTILKSEILESDCVGVGCGLGQQYLNFQTLKKLISKEELIDLTKHENPILRMYASIDLIESESNKGNVVDLFKFELKKKDTIARVKGCLTQDELTYSIIYNTYRGKIFYYDGLYDLNLSAEDAQIKQERLIIEDGNLEIMDRIIINSVTDLNFVLYERAFEFRKYSGNDLERVSELAFEKNNASALMYLKFVHPESYDAKIDKYLRTDFISANFDSPNGVFYLYSIIEYLLETENKEFRKIVVEKLKRNDSWKSDKAWFQNILENYGLKI